MSRNPFKYQNRIYEVDKKALKKSLFELTKELIIYAIKNKIIDEFKRQKLDILFKEEIEAWFIYLDQQEFRKELEKKILAEVERYIDSKKTIEELIKEIFPQPKIEWEKIFINGISKNYFFKSALGYA